MPRLHGPIYPLAIQTSARPQVEADWLGGWPKQPTGIRVWPGDEHDRILIITAVEATSIPFEVTDVDDVDDVPECGSDDPLAPSDALDAWCELPCEPSAFFPPLSDPVDVATPSIQCPLRHGSLGRSAGHSAGVTLGRNRQAPTTSPDGVARGPVCPVLRSFLATSWRRSAWSTPFSNGPCAALPVREAPRRSP